MRPPTLVSSAQILFFIFFFCYPCFFSGFLNRIVPSFSGFSKMAPSFTEYLWVLLDVTGFLPRSTEFVYGYLSDLGWFGLIKFSMGFTRFYWVLPSFNEYLWVLIDFPGLYRVFVGCIWFYWVLPSFY